jgi:hypothetical protein
MIKPTITLQELRERIGQRAKSAPTHRFWGLYVHIVKHNTLEAAYLEAKRNAGAPGSDGETFEQIEGAGRERFLERAHTGSGRTAGERFRRGAAESARSRSPRSGTVWFKAPFD